MVWRKTVNIDHPNAWWSSRSLLKPWEFKSKADGLQVTFFYQKSMPASDLLGPNPNAVHKQVSLCTTWFSSPALAAEIIAAS